MRTKPGLALAAALALLIAGCGTRATTPLPQEQVLTGQMVNQSDANAATESYRIVQLDNQEGQLAAAQSTDPQVRTLAAELIGKANQLYPQLEEQLQRTGITPARVLPRVLQGKVDRLGTLRGRTFDRQYLADQIESHQRALVVFQDGLSRSQDAGIKALLTQAVPVVQDSLDKLQALRAKLG